MIERIAAALRAAGLAHRVGATQPDQWRPVYVAAPMAAVRASLPAALLVEAAVEGDTIYFDHARIAIYGGAATLD